MPPTNKSVRINAIVTRCLLPSFSQPHIFAGVMAWHAVPPEMGRWRRPFSLGVEIKKKAREHEMNYDTKKHTVSNFSKRPVLLIRPVPFPKCASGTSRRMVNPQPACPGKLEEWTGAVWGYHTRTNEKGLEASVETGLAVGWRNSQYWVEFESLSRTCSSPILEGFWHCCRRPTDFDLNPKSSGWAPIVRQSRRKRLEDPQPNLSGDLVGENDVSRALRHCLKRYSKFQISKQPPTVFQTNWNYCYLTRKESRGGVAPLSLQIISKTAVCAQDIYDSGHPF
ncbi:hypothetical protein P175DRAFT_0529090 [Aspergillus ochraceoroseus IBT 24754]|uniref:Uncharacterized protein n=1 Tax=Aspergillus ochraceoroseus IBT 24754 TaxID=1392256 RepID=A0A2T5MAH2_9EURO|nr:uncharacterized protein P175DRAFT_0529090 [Aspergillus ochraceoroseus IBT 24754]PTU25533.1 hypothetical protein P175DRAFT_0529090 [Aspergillus ochraceoroseus IBT 24754]